MKQFLLEEDLTDNTPIAHLANKMDNVDVRESQDYLISVQYNEIDLGKTTYGFDQEFKGNEANQYFERMKTFSEMSINDIIDKGLYSWHFNRTGIKGNIKKVFDSIDPKIAKANPMIYHFALDPKCKITADRSKGNRNARVYFMVGYYGMIHPIFFDPYHELNPMSSVKEDN